MNEDAVPVPSPLPLSNLMKDPYEALGVPRSASDDEIKKAFRRMAQKHHPDRNKGNSESEKRFKDINMAYQILSDKSKRAQYDQFGSAGDGGSQGGFQGFEGFSGGAGGFADIFETFFGGSGGQQTGGRRGPQSGDDLEVGITITLHDAAFGVEKDIKIRRIDTCQTCSGDGTKPGTKLKICDTCGGKGEVHSVRTTILGQMSTRHVCDRCGGAGKTPETPCGDCHGAGRKNVEKKLTVRIPAGVGDSSVIRLSGQGNAGSLGGKSGDLYVHVGIQPDSQFSRRENDIYSDATIHLLQAVLGDEVEINTLHGKVKLSIPAGTQPNKLFRVRGYGIPSIHNRSKGDHYVRINIHVPEKLSKKEKELYGNLTKESKLKLKEDKGVFGKIFE